jgi:hypothetical protein
MSNVSDRTKHAEWKAGGEIGPDPKRQNSPSALYIKHFYEHDRWIRTEGRFGKRMILQTRQLSHRVLDGVDFSGAIFANVTFSNVSFRETLFKNAKFFGVSFDHCDLDKSDFTGATGKEVRFDGSNPERAEFGEGKTGIDEKGPDRNEIKFVGRAKAKYHSL